MVTAAEKVQARARGDRTKKTKKKNRTKEKSCTTKDTEDHEGIRSAFFPSRNFVSFVFMALDLSVEIAVWTYCTG